MAGQIVKRGEKTWIVRIFQGRDENGKRRYINKTIHGTKKDAEKWLNKALRDKDLGIYVEPTAETVSQFLSRWLETIAKTRVSERTFRGYEWHLGVAKRELGDLRLSALRALDIQRFYASLTPSNAKHVHAPLSSALSQAVKWNLIHVNPADAVELPRHKAKEIYAFSRDEAARFLAVPNKYQTLFAFAIDSGARPSEVLALRWLDLDLDNATVTIQRTLQRHKGKGGGWYFSEPKTRKSRRRVPLTPGIVRSLKEYRVRRGEQLLSWGVRSDLVFCSDSGTPLVLENLTKRHFKPILKAPRFRPQPRSTRCATLAPHCYSQQGFTRRS